MDEATWTNLKADLAHSDPIRRKETAILLGNCRQFFDCEPEQKFVVALAPLLSDVDEKVRYHTAKSLGCLGLKAAVPYLAAAVGVQEDSRLNIVEAIESAIRDLD